MTLARAAAGGRGFHGRLGLVPAQRAARVTAEGISWNYTTILNVIFLLLGAALLVRFFRSGGGPMLKMMGGSPEEHDHPDPGRRAALRLMRPCRALTGQDTTGASIRGLASYCLHTLTSASNLPSAAAVRRLVAVTLSGLRLPPGHADPVNGTPCPARRGETSRHADHPHHH